MSTPCSLSITVARAHFPVQIDLTLAAGSVHALVGPNGAGKTTVAEAIAGCVRPASGLIQMGDTVVARVASGARRPEVWLPAGTRGVGYLDQHPRLFPHLTAAGNVAFGLRARGRRVSEARATALQWLDRLGIAETAESRPHQLSGGQRQRVALARVLATEPELLLLDEPFSALAADSLPEVRDIVRQCRAERSITTLLVTHSVVDAWVLADTLTVMESGRVVETGPTSEVLTRPAHPFTARLAGLNTQPIGSGDDPHRVAFSPSHVELSLLGEGRPVPQPVAGEMAWKGTVRSLDHSAAGVSVRVRVDSALPVPDIIAETPFGGLADIHPGARVLCRVRQEHRDIYPAR